MSNAIANNSVILFTGKHSDFIMIIIYTISIINLNFVTVKLIYFMNQIELVF